MPLEKIYVVRHGFRSSWSVDPNTGVYMGIPSPTRIQGDPALTSYGIDQAKELGRHLETLHPAIEKVYSSPFYRCLQTMVPFMELQQDKKRAAQRSQGLHPSASASASMSTVDNDAAQAGNAGNAGNAGDAGEQEAGATTDARSLLTGPVVTEMLPEHGIREWFGSAPFDHPEPAAPGVLKAMFPWYHDGYVSNVTPSRKGETLQELQQRITTALRGIIRQCDADGTRAIVLCSHAAVIILIGRILTGLVPVSVDVDDFHAYTCGLSVYRRRGGVAVEGNNISDNRDDRHSASEFPQPDTAKTNLIGGWDCELNSDCSFLSGGAERGWSFTGDESFPDTGSLSQADAASSKL